jgi:transcriptional regulator GlxA family with amidase domain
MPVHQALLQDPLVASAELIQRRRPMLATHLLGTTRSSIAQTAEQVGYPDSTTLRRLIRRDLGTSPSGLR